MMDANVNENGLQKTEVSEIRPTSMFATKDLFEHVQRVAKLFSQSDLVPKKYSNNMGNCIIALEMANRIGASPLMVMQNLDVILGKPAWSSKFLIASLNASGKFSPLRYEEDDQDGGRTRACAFDKYSGEKVYGAWVSMKMAQAEGWIDKNGSKWKTMPELMRRYRAASFFTNQFAPEISMGLSTSEEVYDITPAGTGNGGDNNQKQSERISGLLADCKTVDEVNQLQAQMSDVDASLFNVRKDEIVNELRASEQPPQEMSNEVFMEIETAESMSNINAICEAYPALQNSPEFRDAINKKKISLGKKLQKQTA